MPISKGSYNRKIRGNSHHRFTNIETAALCRDVLRNTYGEQRAAAKAAAEDSNQSPRAAENWIAGENPMSLTAFLNAYHNNPAFKAWARKLLLMEQDLDPHFERELHSFIRAAQRYGAETP